MKTKIIPTRFIISQSNKNENELILQLTSTFAINDQSNDIFECYLRDFWTSLSFEIGDYINVLNPRIENHDSAMTMIVDNKDGLIIVRPDVLLPITTLMSASFCMRKAWLSRMFDIFGEPNKALLIGTMVHEIFQESLRRKTFNLSQVENLFLKEIINNFTLDIYGLNITRDDLIADIKPYLQTISVWLKLYHDQNNPNNLFSIKRVTDIESTIWSTKYGLIGKIDLILEALLKNQKYQSNDSDLIPLELKTGRRSFSPQHMGQVILYSFIMAEKNSRPQPCNGYLLYLKDEPKTELIKSNHNVFRDLLLLRNRFVPYYDKIGLIEEKNMKELLFKGPKTIDSYVCENCDHNLDCSLIHTCFESNSHQSDDDFHFSELSLSHLMNTEVEFFSNMISQLEIERQHNLASEEFVSFWNFRSEECEMAGIGLSKMKIKYQDERTIVFVRHPKVSLPEKLLELNSDLKINLSLLEGRRAVISEEMANSTKNYEIFGNFCKRLCVSIGQIIHFSEDVTEIGIQLEKSQIDFINPNAVYRIDFLKNISTRATVINFSNLLRLMYDNDPKAQELRQIVIHGIIPKFNLNDCKVASFAQIINSPILSSLNIQQKRSILGILRTKCSLIFGSPGSGKTQTIVALIQILVEMGYSVLVTSFTHVAVDNILLKLVESNQKLNKNVDFLRTGNIKRIKPELMDYSDHSRTMTWRRTGNINALSNFYSTISVVASTCLGVLNHPLFTKRTFDFCIIDEASQVFLSTSLGPLFNCKNFVLVGDQKQLPPVVQSKLARAKGLDESLFSRLLTMANKQDVFQYDDSTDCPNFEDISNKKIKNNVDMKSIRIFPLFIQYRMNSVIMQVANRLTYAGKLKCGTKEIENISMMDFLLDGKRHMLEEYQQSYLSKVISPYLHDSVVFIDTSSIEHALENHDNEGFSQKNSLNTAIPITYVHNDFEARLIIRIVEILLLIYKKEAFKANNIGIISPFRKQVNRLVEMFDSQFTSDHNLEINTVDQYQGRDKDVIIYSCVKSNVVTASTDDNRSSLHQNTFVVTDSELLKDERRLNVAVTRAKRKLIVIGNRSTLNGYLPFRNLFNVLESEQFISLIEYDYQDIIRLL